MRTVALDTMPDVALTARDVAVLAESIDTRNWLDQHAAAPEAVRRGRMLDHHYADGLAMVSSAIPFSHFNMVLTFAVARQSPARSIGCHRSLLCGVAGRALKPDEFARLQEAVVTLRDNLIKATAEA